MPPYESTLKDDNRENIEKRMNNTKEILYEGFYYDVTNFVKRHPGGREIIGYFTKPGEDATIPIQQFHGRTIEKIHGIMKTLQRRPATEILENDEDEETKKKNKALTEDFTKLYLELKAEGLFEPSYAHVAYRLTEIVVFALAGYYIVTQYNDIWIKVLGCLILSMAQGRVEWVQHEAGHISLTGSPKVDRLIQTYFVGAVMGWSGIFWRRHHNLHHAMTQRLRRDVDVEFTPLFLINEQVLDDPIKEQNFFLRNQIYFSPIFSLIVALHVLFWETGKCLLKYKIFSEFVAVGLHYLVAYQIGLWPWLFTHLLMTTYLGLNFSLSHSHLPVTNKPTHWVEHGLVHTAYIEQRPWCDWWMGYLNYQIEHHLFPTMPQFRNKLAVERVRALAKKHGLSYHLFSYKEAVVRTVQNVVDISQNLKKLKKNKSLGE